MILARRLLREKEAMRVLASWILLKIMRITSSGRQSKGLFGCWFFSLKMERKPPMGIERFDMRKVFVFFLFCLKKKNEKKKREIMI